VARRDYYFVCGHNQFKKMSYLAERRKAAGAAASAACLCCSSLIALTQKKEKWASTNITFPAGSVI
jgi:hypothetical protein